jgi:hypothetical protein
LADLTLFLALEDLFQAERPSEKPRLPNTKTVKSTSKQAIVQANQQ